MAPQAKGTNFRGFLRALERLHGPAVVDRTLELLDRELQNAMRCGEIVTSGWYPLEWYRLLHLAAQRATHRGPDLSREIGHTATKEDFLGIYRILTFVLSPQFVIARSPGVFHKYFDCGTIEIEEARDGQARGTFFGCSGFDENLWQDLIGGCVGVLEVCGAKNIDVRVLEGGTSRADSMSLLTTWSRRHSLR